MRKGIATTEFWIGLVAIVLVTVQQSLWPDSPFPKTEFMAIVAWIAARIGEKTLGSVGVEDKRAWQTSEFWLAIGFAVTSQFVDIPKSVVNMVYVWVIGRPATKVAKDFKLTDLVGQKTAWKKGK